PPVADAAEVSCRIRGSVWSIKAGVRETLYEHQQEGFEFLWRNLAGSTDIVDLRNSNLPGVGGCIISHAPGTGKTRLTLVFLETYLKMFPNCLPMIIVPATILGTWEAELRRWNASFHFHNLNNPAFTGDERAAADHLFNRAKIRCRDTEAIRMINIYSWKRGGGLLGTSYNLFEKLTEQKDEEANAGEVGFLRSTLLEMPGLVILDEGHTSCNERSKIWASLVQVKTDKRIILSGTPFQNNFTELFNTVNIVRPTAAEEIMQDRTFAEILHSDKKTHSSRPALLPEAVNCAVERLKVSMSPFVHVHKGTILQKNLPGLRDSVILLKPTGLQKKLIDILEGERLKRIITNEHGFSLVSIHPYLIRKCKSQVPTDGIDMQAVEASKFNPFEGVKTKFILEFVRLCMMLKEKVLIFCQNLTPLELIKDHLAATFQWNARKEILRLEGKLPKKQRQRVIDAFNDPENDSKILLASTRCCSEGISLVGASRVILLDVVWNPSVEQQAISRAYRIGQKKFVHTYHLMTAGTLEADKYCRQAEKERLSELVFCSSSNEKDISKQPMPKIKDKILQEMVQHAKTKDIFEKIIHQPKNADLSQCLHGRDQTLRGNIQQEYSEVFQRRAFTGDSEQIFQNAIREQGRGQFLCKKFNFYDISDNFIKSFMKPIASAQIHVFIDLAVLVDAQGGMLDNIESQLLYETCLCVWLLSYYEPAVEFLATSRCWPPLIEVVKGTTKEKVTLLWWPQIVQNLKAQAWSDEWLSSIDNAASSAHPYSQSMTITDSQDVQKLVEERKKGLVELRTVIVEVRNMHTELSTWMNSPGGESVQAPGTIRTQRALKTPGTKVHEPLTVGSRVLLMSRGLEENVAKGIMLSSPLPGDMLAIVEVFTRVTTVPDTSIILPTIARARTLGEGI
ncbi:SNF2 domain-containing protein CLASSY 3-like, partial [Andrographis paniculata]|uniref:SNF2 domain-containing protein CLASSY 3-like n=1 Tax=Andrographis paniculata TaxID=175694 RepID=UPI0021E7338C